MKRLLVLLVFLPLFFSQVSAQTTAPRYAVCDLCGYCPDSNPTPPSSWKDCAQCIYGLDPNSASADSKVTLEIDDATNLPPTPIPGHQYTTLGCIRTNGFQSNGAAASVVQIILNIIFSITGGIALLSLMYGAFIIMTSQNNPERINFGKKIVYGAIIGAIFTFMSVLIVNFIASGVLKIPGFGTNP